MHLIATTAALAVFFLTFPATEQVDTPPSIISGPPATTFYLHPVQGTKDLICEATGTPPLSYFWYRNGGDALSDQNGPVLKLETDMPDVEGYYKCAVVSSRYGTAVSNVTRVLKARQAGFKEKPVTSKTHRLGDKLALPCNFQVSPVPEPKYDSFTWKEGDKTITFSQRVQMDGKGTLYFAAVTSDDFGKVRKCLVSTTEASAIITEAGGTQIIREPTEQQVYDRKPEIFFYSNMTANPNSPATTVIALEGLKTLLRCFFSGSVDIRISWRRRNSPGLDFPRVSEIDPKHKSELAIDDVRESDEDEYICTGSNSVGSTDFTTRLIVHAEPRFLSDDDRPHNINATVGQDVVVRCRAYAKPTAKIDWFKNGVKIQPGTRDYSNFRLNGDSTELTIEKVCKSNCSAGVLPGIMVIQCNASNEHNYAYSNGYINVFEETKFIKRLPEEVRVEKPGDHVVLTVQAESDPATPVTFVWYYKGRPLPENDPRRRIIHSSDGKSSTLTINSTSSSDYGEYTCNATNGVDATVTKASLSGPEPPLDASVWIALLVLLIILFIFAIGLAVGCALYQNRGEDYPVDETERKQGNDPDQDLEDAGFHPFQRKERGSQSDVGSLHSRTSTDRQYDEESTLIRERRGSQGGGQLYS